VILETHHAPPPVVTRCAAVATVEDEPHCVTVETELSAPRRYPGLNALTVSQRLSRRLPSSSPRPQVRSRRVHSCDLVCFLSGPSGGVFFRAVGGAEGQEWPRFFPELAESNSTLCSNCFFMGHIFPARKSVFRARNGLNEQSLSVRSK
jgi:hypothetical protein